MPEAGADITALLQSAQQGNAQAADELASAVYDELHRVARAYLSREREGHSLQPTALVHDAFLALVEQKRARWQNRTQFFVLAAQHMRRLLVDHARRAGAAKRSAQLVPLDEGVPDTDAARALDLVRVDDALAALARIDPRQARIVELRFFGGLTIDETAEALGVSPVTVSREWAVARAWLHAELTDT